MDKKKTSRGKYINMEELMAQQPSTPALGNMGVNARGDRLGRGGEITESNTTRVRAYYKDNPKSSTASVSLKDPVNTAPQKKILTPDLDQEPEETVTDMLEEEAPKPKRKSRKKKTEAKVEEVKESEAELASEAGESVSDSTEEVSTESQNTDQVLPSEPEEFDQDTHESEETPHIEVMTEDGDILMMTTSEHEEYLKQQGEQ